MIKKQLPKYINIKRYIYNIVAKFIPCLSHFSIINSITKATATNMSSGHFGSTFHTYLCNRKLHARFKKGGEEEEEKEKTEEEEDEEADEKG